MTNEFSHRNAVSNDTNNALVHLNLTATELVEQAISRKEGYLSSTGALSVNTGARTGRSPLDRFIVRDAMTEENVDWGDINQPFDSEDFKNLWTRVERYLHDREKFINTLHVGNDNEYYEPVRVITQKAWHSLFANIMLVRPEHFNPNNKQEWTLLSIADFECDPERDHTHSDCCTIIDFTHKKVLLAGMKYAGESKKAMFSVLNYILPNEGVLPMHCSANVDRNGRTTLFFGLSGTGKTTLSADPDCALIGDDEHGWANGRVFNFEGGCYAKTLNLSCENEPLIWHAIRFGSVLENVVLDNHRIADYSDTLHSENGRVAYPLEYIEKRASNSCGSEPSAIIFLTCDMTGVLPPVSLLSPDAAAYHFLSGYTAKVGSTEVGTTSSLSATFSTCFGAPFFAHPPHVYAELLKKRMAAFPTHVYLVNTGWSGGAYGAGGERFSIPVTRTIINAIQEGKLIDIDTIHIDGLNLDIPASLAGVDDKLLDPRKAWEDKKAYQAEAGRLIEKFRHNFSRFEGIEEATLAAGPQPLSPSDKA